jgi:hypothetical protein
VGPRAGLDVVAKRKIPCPCWESSPGHPARSLVTVVTELSQLHVNNSSSSSSSVTVMKSVAVLVVVLTVDINSGGDSSNVSSSDSHASIITAIDKVR